MTRTGSITNYSLKDSICAIAGSGLRLCYPDKDSWIPYSLVENGKGVVRPVGDSIRYALISQIGITRWLKYHPQDKPYLPDLWPRILAAINNINHIGDFSLLLWAAAESERADCDRFAKMITQRWFAEQQNCNAVELGWVVQSLVCLFKSGGLEADTEKVLKNARDKLLSLYSPVGRLFARHNRTGFTRLVSRRISCFADQVYPILALASFGGCFSDSQSIETAVAVADTICRLQGPQGQWWWHYDAQRGKVAEEYPVFSVHQHAMAPMALFVADSAAVTDHRPSIEKGLVWLNEQNELNEQMMEPAEGIIWRDIHRREPGKAYRCIRGLLAASGFNRMHRLAGKNIFGYVLNRECRPYELGWILYAWADKSPAAISRDMV